jgi:hypothetical protein
MRLTFIDSSVLLYRHFTLNARDSPEAELKQKATATDPPISGG